MIFKFKIKIEGISKPPVWRKVEIPSTFTFFDFHNIIQIIFGWYDAHLWCFEPRKKSGRDRLAFQVTEPGEHTDWLGEGELFPASETALGKIIPWCGDLLYIYDFGDYWEHSITLEDVIPEDREYAVCTAGKGTTPPEDCGGAYRYEQIKEAFAKRDQEEMNLFREWMGLEADHDWDPAGFSAEEQEDINIKLKKITASKAGGQAPAKGPGKGPLVGKYYGRPEYYTTQELLKNFTIPELRRLSLILGFRLKSGLYKDLIVEAVANLMFEHPEDLIKGAFYYELKAFLDIINGDMSPEYAEESGLLFELNRFGLIYALDRKKGKDTTSSLHFQMDLADILAPLIPAELERRERDGSLMMEKLALGCANLYGYTDLRHLQDYVPEVEERTGRTFDSDTLSEASYPILSVLGSCKKNERQIMLSPFTHFVNFYPDERHIRIEETPKKFDLDTILKYGEMPYPRFEGKKADAVRNMLQRYGKPGCSPDEILRKIWLNHQEAGMGSPLPDLDFLMITSPSAIQPCLDAIVDFQNNVPCWMLRGNSSQEAAKRSRAAMNGRMPNITMGPNMRAMGINSFDQLMEMARNGKDLPAQPPIQSAKVGRNDPCPCGSGKKYKHCCGRNK